MNLVVKDALGTGRKGTQKPLSIIRNILESCRRVAGYFHHSVKGK